MGRIRFFSKRLISRPVCPSGQTCLGSVQAETAVFEFPLCALDGRQILALSYGYLASLVRVNWVQNDAWAISTT